MSQPQVLSKAMEGPRVASPNQKPKLWADSVPLAWKPYIQLTRIDLFAGSLLLFWPCTWGLTLAAIKTNLQLSSYVLQTGMFLLWSILLHSVGSTWNDICDKDYDRLVERTKTRPLAMGSISVKAAMVWMSPQVLILIGFLSQLNATALSLGLFELFFITAIYPFMKRITYWPQAWLGIAFSWGAIIAWTANAPPNWTLMGLNLVTGCSWTIFYDTIYAMMDKKDDTQAGIRSTALLFGHRARLILSFFAALCVLGLLFTGLATKQELPFFILSVLGSALHFMWQITTVVFDDGASCLLRFQSNGTQLGLIISSGMLVNYGLYHLTV